MIYRSIFRFCLNVWVYLVQWETSSSRRLTGKNYFLTEKQNCITSRIATSSLKRRECICWIEPSFRIKLCRISSIANYATCTSCISLLMIWRTIPRKATRLLKTWLKASRPCCYTINRLKLKTQKNSSAFLVRTANISIQSWLTSCIICIKTSRIDKTTKINKYWPPAKVSCKRAWSYRSHSTVFYKFCSWTPTKIRLIKTNSKKLIVTSWSYYKNKDSKIYWLLIPMNVLLCWYIF